jgi:hypothetical protein
MPAGESLERGGGSKLEEQGLLFDYTVKLLLLAAFLELVLYRLISRLGMHLAKVAEKHEWVRVTFKTLSSVGLTLLNFVSLLVFLAILLFLFNRMRRVGAELHERLLIPALSLLVLLTVAFLVYPPAMLGSVVYNILSFVVIAMIVAEYLRAHQLWRQRAMVFCYLLGITGWLYYQTVSTGYGLLGLVAVPPLVHEVNRAGEAFMVLASILVFWAYGGTPFWSKNRRQRRRALIFLFSAVGAFLALLFLDFFLMRYDRSVAESIRKAGEGIGWIFQMGMGYTFYLPFAFYVTGLLCWGYTVIKLITLGRMAGFGLGLMFLAGYALQLSHLTLMVVLGLLLLNLDRRRFVFPAREHVQDPLVARSATTLVGEQA